MAWGSWSSAWRGKKCHGSVVLCSDCHRVMVVILATFMGRNVGEFEQLSDCHSRAVATPAWPGLLLEGWVCFPLPTPSPTPSPSPRHPTHRLPAPVLTSSSHAAAETQRETLPFFFFFKIFFFIPTWVTVEKNKEGAWGSLRLRDPPTAEQPLFWQKLEATDGGGKRTS